MSYAAYCVIIVCTVLFTTMPHADSSYLPPSVTTKAQLWDHIYEQLATLIDGQRQWVS